MEPAATVVTRTDAEIGPSVGTPGVAGVGDAELDRLVGREDTRSEIEPLKGHRKERPPPPPKNKSSSEQGDSTIVLTER